MASEIARFAVYPAIGVARVGNSPKEWFFGPELPGPHPPDADRFRDAAGRIKRQVARFRVYGLDKDGRVVAEVTSDQAKITWTCKVANTKAAWYDFDLALDIPDARGAAPVASARRNAKVADRASLKITPSAVTVSGRNVNADGADASCRFADGKFQGTPVYLGELRTDGQGRLLFFGGRGLSASPSGKPATTFANNDGWHDDISDGPVDATVVYRGKTYKASGAWVVTGPPNYAPGVQSMVTGYDLLREVGAALDPSLLPTRPAFHRDILPILRRLTRSQWVNAGYARDYGAGTPNDMDDPALVARLADPGHSSRRLREAVFGWFRPADYSQAISAAEPKMYGDAVTMNTAQAANPRTWMALLESQWRWLEQWADGDFDPDQPPAVPAWDQLSPAEQVGLLDRGVLDETLGGPFHPGAEFTWPMRQKIMYSAPFRIKRRTTPRPSLGPTLDATEALARGGPLDGSGPGDLTRWMAVPWQTDTSSCLSAYVPYVDDYLPTFWPARVPNDVLTSAQYATLKNPTTSPEAKQDAFAATSRVKWLRGIKYASGVHFPAVTYPSATAINKFITLWWRVGIVTTEPGPGAGFPDPILVETGRSIAAGSAAPPPGGAAGAPESAKVAASSVGPEPGPGTPDASEPESGQTLIEDWIQTRRR